jgi:hypothetical protein
MSCPLLSLVPTCASFPLQCGEPLVQSPEAAVPETSIVLEPRVNFRKRRCSDSTRPPLGLAAPRHETSRLEYANVLGHRARRHPERFSELCDRRLTFQESIEDGAPRGIGERGEGGAELIACHCGTIRLWNQLVL